MTVYNTERYISQALDSILAQTSPPDEIVVVDDGSTDGTPDVLRGYAKQIRLIRQQNCGPARALNVAMAAANGDAFAFLDADDLWVPDKLRIQIAALAAEQDLEAVFGAIQQFASPDLDSDEAKGYIVPDAPQPGISKNALLIRRDAFERIGPFDEQYTASEFVDWYARASARGLRARMLPEVLALRRHHPGNLGRRERSKQNSEVLEILKRSLDLRRGKPGPDAKP